MAGGLVYVGKSRLRRWFKQQRIHNRIKRTEKRQQRKLEKQLCRAGQEQGSSASPSPTLQAKHHLDSNNNNKDNNNNNHNNNNNNNVNRNGFPEKHACHFCGDCDSVDADIWSFGSFEDDDLLPLIDLSASLGVVFDKMPFFNKKKKEEEERQRAEEEEEAQRKAKEEEAKQRAEEEEAKQRAEEEEANRKAAEEEARIKAEEEEEAKRKAEEEEEAKRKEEEEERKNAEEKEANESTPLTKEVAQNDYNTSVKKSTDASKGSTLPARRKKVESQSGFSCCCIM